MEFVGLLSRRTTRRVSIAAAWLAACGSLAVAGGALAQAADRPAPLPGLAGGALTPVYRVGGGLTEVGLYATGERVMLPAQTIWKYACGSDTRGLTAETLRRDTAGQDADFADPTKVRIVDFSHNDAGLDLVFSLGASVPSAAVPAFAAAEAYLQSLFSDPVTVTISVSFAALSPGVIGSTGSNFVTASYSQTRTGLVNGRDADDTIQTFLPSGSTIPVRFGSSSATTSIGTVYWTIADCRASLGTVSGTAATMRYSTAFSFDWNPADGVPGSQISFQDVVIHETGHALGFVSSVDWGTAEMTTLDLFRFQRTQQNPATTGDFTSFPRCITTALVDDANSDVVSAEFRMSDGRSYQGSHFREQSPTIGIMDPAFSGGQTFYPTFMKTSDLTMFDAIGWDYTPGGGGCVSPGISTQPTPVTTCVSLPATFSVLASGTSPTYQWMKGAAPITGATSSSYTIASVTTLDAGQYSVKVTNACGTVTSNQVALTVNGPPVIILQPESQQTCVGGSVSFQAAASGSGLSYQWQKGASVIPGAVLPGLILTGVQTSDAGTYLCKITNACGSTFTVQATLTVNSLPSITAQPQSITVAAGAPASFSVSAGGASSYQWFKEASAIAGAIASVYTIPAAQASDAGSYSVRVTNDCGTTASATATLTVTGGCRVDCTSDGKLDVQDFGCFQNKFALGDPYADFNSDGKLDILDFSAFQNQFALGCP